MEIRTPAVSGTFYPGDENELKDLIHECFLHELGPGKIPPTYSDQKIYGVWYAPMQGLFILVLLHAIHFIQSHHQQAN